jgi:benzoyl-CoA reductase/2-hydroxyglutaryl-CoA dehydratase subunit BcrC/BadD/HgdB
VIGITATIPVEIVFSAGFKPVDLNNLFITSANPRKLVSQAEAEGFSHNTCAWIKGIHSTVVNNDINQVIAVTGGDCSNTIALGELLARRGVNVISFEYPLTRERTALWSQMDKLRQNLATTWDGIEAAKSVLDRIRGKIRSLDRLTWQKNVVTGSENHLFMVSSSDFNGDPESFEKNLDQFLSMAEKRAPATGEIRLGCLGVPPIFTHFHEFIESLGARVVFNEVPRQFSMPYGRKDIVDQYLDYTYPYDINGRLRDIKQAVRERYLDGLIHYTQTFCYRQIYDIIIRKDLEIPVLTLEGDRPGMVDGRTSLRIETFVEMLKEKS